MKNILIDAGPLIAIFDKDDKFHNSVLNFFKQFSGEMITTWPVITEVTHILNFNIKIQIDFLEWLHRDALTIFNLEKRFLERIIQLSKKYSDVPMDLADSSLLVVSESTGIKEIATIDSDYYIYRTKKGRSLKNVLQPFLNNLN